MGLTLDGRANPRRLASGTLPRASHDAPKPALCKAPHITPPGPLASPLALNSASADSLPQAPKSSGLRPGPSPPAASDEAPDIFRDVARQPELLISALGSIDRDSRGWPFESDLKLVLTHWQRLLHPPRYSDRRFVIGSRNRSTSGRSTTTRSPRPARSGSRICASAPTARLTPQMVLDAPARVRTRPRAPSTCARCRRRVAPAGKGRRKAAWASAPRAGPSRARIRGPARAAAGPRPERARQTRGQAQDHEGAVGREHRRPDQCLGRRL